MRAITGGQDLLLTYCEENLPEVKSTLSAESIVGIRRLCQVPSENVRVYVLQRDSQNIGALAIHSDPEMSLATFVLLILNRGTTFGEKYVAARHFSRCVSEFLAIHADLNVSLVARPSVARVIHALVGDEFPCVGVLPRYFKINDEYEDGHLFWRPRSCILAADSSKRRES